MRRGVLTATVLALVLAAPAATASSAPSGAAAVAALFRGIPQHGVVLGRSTAPVTLVEFADLQCPYCARWERDVLPEIVRRYVRSGKVRLVFSGVAFLGPESLTALRTVLAAGSQNRLWNVVELLYLNQGRENSGWLTTSFVRRIGAAVHGLDVDAMLARRSSAAVERQRAAATTLAQAVGVYETPFFAVGLTNTSLRPLAVDALTATAIEPTLDALLRG